MLLYDSDNPDSIPDGVWAAGYVDGYAAPAWAARGWSRFPNAVRIACFAFTNDGHALDVEQGDATPEQAPAWVRMRHAKGIRRPWVYCNRSNRGAVENALVAAGILTDQVALWVATLDGTEQVAAGRYPVAAVQYLNSAHSGGHYDISTVNPLFAAGAGGLEAELFDPNDPIVIELRAKIQNIEDSISYVPATEGAPLKGWILRQLKALAGSGGGTEAPEPAEPRTVTLDIPAQKISGTLS